MYTYASAARPDGSVVLAGTTYGSWKGDLSGTDAVADFIAVALDEDGEELWRWQVRLHVKVLRLTVLLSRRTHTCRAVAFFIASMINRW